MLDVRFWEMKASLIAWAPLYRGLDQKDKIFFSGKFFFDFCLLKSWTRIGSGSGSVLSLKCLIWNKWIRIRNTTHCYAERQYIKLVTSIILGLSMIRAFLSPFSTIPEQSTGWESVASQSVSLLPTALLKGIRLVICTANNLSAYRSSQCWGSGSRIRCFFDRIRDG